MLCEFLSSLFLPLFFAFVSSALWAAKPLLIPRMRTYKRVAQIQFLLNPPHASLEHLLQARAVPNQRLVHAFGLTSTFVSADSKVHKTFTTRAKALITGTGWRTMAQNAESTTHRFLPTHHGDNVDFAAFIQSVTFSVVLAALFGTDPDTLVYNDVVCVTDIINRRWKDSKIKDASTMAKDPSLRRMMEHIDRWVVDRDGHPNPMDFILPAYETLWRVVAVLVSYVYQFHNNTLYDAVVEFGRDPTENRFTEFGDSSSRDGESRTRPSMQAIVFEVLRLHPPTRHIARAPTESQSGPWWKTLLMPAIEIADIEAVHLSDEYGTNPSEFDPMRFHPSRMVGPERRELYAFGYGKLRCIAATWAPMAAAVTAAKVVSQIEEAGCTVMAGNKIGGRSGWDGWSVGKDTK